MQGSKQEEGGGKVGDCMARIWESHARSYFARASPAIRKGMLTGAEGSVRDPLAERFGVPISPDGSFLRPDPVPPLLQHY